MPDRKSQTPIRLRGGLPDGNFNGTGDVARHFLTSSHPSRLLFIGEADRRRLIQDDEQNGSLIAELAVTAIEFPGDQDHLRELLEQHRTERTGAGMLPFDGVEERPDTTSASAKAARLERCIGVWADRERVDAQHMWAEYFGPENVIPGPRGASLLHLMEFVGHHEIPDTEITASPPPQEGRRQVGPEDHGYFVVNLGERPESATSSPVTADGGDS